MNIPEIQKKIKTNKNLHQYEVNELRYVQTPIGKQLYEHDTKKGRPIREEKAHYNDKIKCPICGKLVSRSNQTKHKKTQKCQIYNSMNEKIRDTLLK